MGDTLRPPRAKHPYLQMADSMVLWRAAALMAIPAAAAAVGWAAYEIKHKPAVETVFVLVDEETRVLHTAVARAWTFDEQAKADVAREWVWHMRNRPISKYATEILRKTMWHRTAERALVKVETMLREMDEKLGHGADGSEQGKLGLALSTDIQTGRYKTDPETGDTVIRVDWQERTIDKDNRVGPWQHSYVYLHIRAIEAVETVQAMNNGLGLYVVDFTPIGRGRPKSDSMASSG